MKRNSKRATINAQLISLAFLCFSYSSNTYSQDEIVQEIRVEDLLNRGVLFEDNGIGIFSSTIEAPGDIDADGFSDLLLLFHPRENDAELEPGDANKVFLIYGRNDLPSHLNSDTLTAYSTTFVGPELLNDSPTPFIAGSITGVEALDDFDLDGHPDFMVLQKFAQPQLEDPDQNEPSPGLATLVFGGKDWPEEVQLYEPPDEIRTARFTSSGTRSLYIGSAAVSGDLNGDQKPDLVLGAAFSEDEIFPSPRGKVYILFGSDELRSTVDVEKIGIEIEGTIIEGSTSGQILGSDLKYVGDVNGDGIGDLLIGAPNSAGHQPGEAFVVFGQESWPPIIKISELIDDKKGIWFNGTTPSSSIGRSLESLNDLDQDGHTDFLISALGDNGEAGRVFLEYGNAFSSTINLQEFSPLRKRVIFEGIPTGQRHIPGERAGSGLSALDFDGDSNLDISISSPNLRTRESREVGKIYVIETKNLNPNSQPVIRLDDSSPIKTIVTSETSMSLGRSLKAVGDVNGDGLDDLLASAPSNSLSSPTELTSRVYLFYGQDDQSEPFTLSELRPRDLPLAGDVEIELIGSGFDTSLQVEIGGREAQVIEIATSARATIKVPPGSELGSTNIVIKKGEQSFELAEGVNYIPRWYPPLQLAEEDSRFFSLIDPGNLSSPALLEFDGDAFADIITCKSGELLLIYGGIKEDLQLQSEHDNVVHIFHPGFEFRTVVDIGDINNDGFNDIALTSRREEPPFHILFGGVRLEGRLSWFDILRLKRGTELSYSGPNVNQPRLTGKVDVTGDGIDDLGIGVGSHRVDNSYKVFVVPGRTEWPASLDIESQISITEGMHAFEVTRFGKSLTFIEDEDGDGVGDIAIGAPGICWEDDGVVYLISSLGIDTQTQLNVRDLLHDRLAIKIDSFKARDSLGRSISFSGDFNSDGFPDLSLGSECGGPDFQGECYVLNGGLLLQSKEPVPLSKIQDKGTRILGRFIEEYFFQTSPAGDLNQDGFSDILVSSWQGQSFIVFGGTNRTVRLQHIAGDGILVEGAFGGVGGLDFDGGGSPDLITISSQGLHVIRGEKFIDTEGFLRGDVDGDSEITITDAVLTLSYQFTGDYFPSCLSSLDFDDNGRVEITDAISSLSYQFLGSASPPEPFEGGCGQDLTEDTLTCHTFCF